MFCEPNAENITRKIVRSLTITFDPSSSDFFAPIFESKLTNTPLLFYPYGLSWLNDQRLPLRFCGAEVRWFDRIREVLGAVAHAAKFQYRHQRRARFTDNRIVQQRKRA